MRESRFLRQLASYLTRLSSEYVEDMRPALADTKSKAAEGRDSTDPKLLTELFVAILAANGQLLTSERVSKRIKDDVCGSLVPWRR